MRDECPSCRATGMRRFFKTAPVPVHSCLMMGDAAAARAFERRAISLGLCRACGFVSNVIFDPGVHDYAGNYEDQQSFSKRFREFQTGLIADLIERHGIRNRNIVEIGCGKGDFLLELCRAGGNRGVGIDPRCNPADAPGGVRFVREYYARRHWGIPCDLLVCRHTLEHLHETDRFIGDLRQALEASPDTLAFFEVPDAGRVFRECAFWDIYYEHCSYFTAGSLARLFRRNGFEVIDLRRVFEAQYLTIVARPTRSPVGQAHPLEEDPGSWTDEIDRFSRAVDAEIAAWRRRLSALAAQNKRIAVWGAGSKCVSFLSTLECEDLVDTVVDINPHQQNRYLPGSGKPITAPETLRGRRPDVVLVMNPVYRQEISRQLAGMGLHPELACVEAAAEAIAVS